MEKPTLLTRRLKLRSFKPLDIDRLAEILGDPSVMRFIPPRKPLSRNRVEAAFNSIIAHWKKHGFGRWAVVHAQDDIIIGWCGLNFLDEISEIEVAYLFDSKYWGRGLATEAAKEVINYGFRKLKLKKIIALSFPENIASQKVMEKIGMTYEKSILIWGYHLKKYVIDRARHV